MAFPNNVIFKKTGNEVTLVPLQTQELLFTAKGLDDLGATLVTDITGPTPVVGGNSITVYKGNGSPTSIGVYSNIVFKQLNGNDLAISTVEQNEERASGTFRVIVDGKKYDVPIVVKTLATQSAGTYDLGTESVIWGSVYARGAVFGRAEDTENNITAINATNVRPATDNTGSVGTATERWANMFATTGNFTNLTVNGNNITSLVPASKGTTGQFWRGGGTNNPSWSNELIGPIIITSAAGANGNTIPSNAAPTNNTGADFRCTGAGYFGRNLTAAKVFNAVFNDYAEYRTTINLTPGHVVVDQDDGSLACSTARLQPGAQVISDTFGHAMGQTFEATTPIAVAGRVLVYPYQARENYHAGMAVCSAPDGTVDIMTREEIKEYPDCIVGIVSEIPQYETWGSDNVKVDGRIWIKI